MHREARLYHTEQFYLHTKSKQEQHNSHCDPGETAELLPSRHKVCVPFCLFFFTLSKKLSGFQVSVQKTIDTVSPNLYN